MNNTFEWSRFKKVLTKDFHNIWPNFGWTMFIIVLLPMAVWLLNVVSRIGESVPQVLPASRLNVIHCMVLLVAIMAPSRLYRSCNLPKDGIYFAMLPASKLEKYLSMWIMCLIVCPVIALVSCLCLDVLLTSLPIGGYVQWFWQVGNWGDFMFANMVEYEGNLLQLTSASLILTVCLGFLGYESLFMFTATVFKKHKVLKTILWLLLFGFVVALLMVPYILRHQEQVLDNLNLMMCYNRALIYSAAVSVLFIWWAWHRLKKMAY